MVRTWESNPCEANQPLEWVLLTSLSCETPGAAQFVAEDYSPVRTQADSLCHSLQDRLQIQLLPRRSVQIMIAAASSAGPPSPALIHVCQFGS